MIVAIALRMPCAERVHGFFRLSALRGGVWHPLNRSFSPMEWDVSFLTHGFEACEEPHPGYGRKWSSRCRAMKLMSFARRIMFRQMIRFAIRCGRFSARFVTRCVACRRMAAEIRVERITSHSYVSGRAFLTKVYKSGVKIRPKKVRAMVP